MPALKEPNAELGLRRTAATERRRTGVQLRQEHRRGPNGPILTGEEMTGQRRNNGAGKINASLTDRPVM